MSAIFACLFVQHIPKLEVIQKSWLLWSEKYLEGSPVVSSDEAVEKPIDILSLLMELLEMYQQLCPAALDPLHSAQSDLKSSMLTTVVKATDSEDAAQLRNRLYQFLLAINDSSFCVENVSVLSLFCKLSVFESKVKLYSLDFRHP